MEFHSRTHYENRMKVPEEELAKYYGKHVAWNLEGTRILASGDSDDDVWNALVASGIDPEKVVFANVDSPNTVYLGGGLIGEFMDGKEGKSCDSNT